MAAGAFPTNATMRPPSAWPTGLGILLTVLPWTRVWTENSLLVGYPAIQSFVQQGFVRGIMTGIPYVEFTVPTGTAEGIAAFYEQCIMAPAHVEDGPDGDCVGGPPGQTRGEHDTDQQRR